MMTTSRGIWILIIATFLFACKDGVRLPFKPAKPFVIAVQPFSGFPDDEVNIVVKAIQEIYSPDTVLLLKHLPLPQQAYTEIKTPRYRADSLIAFLKRNKLEGIRCVIGLTHWDISTTKRDRLGNVKSPEQKYRDWGVFGLGYRPGPSCVVSTFRIRKGVSKETTYDRLRKISAHEVGHNLGLRHCPDKSCLMTDAVEKISTVDNVTFMLCSKCRDIVSK